MTTNNIIGFACATLVLFSGCKQDKSVVPARRNIVEAVFASGNITTENQYVVTSQVDGYLDRSFFSEGDSVKGGQILFRIENSAQPDKLESAEADYRYAVSNVGSSSAALEQLEAQKVQVEARLKTDSLNYARYQKLVSSGSVSKVDFEKAKVGYDISRQDLVSINSQILDMQQKLRLEVVKKKANLSVEQSTSAFYEVKAETSGMIFQIQKQQGELVRKGDPVAEIGSGIFIAELFIAEEDVNKLSIGQTAYIELNTEKNKSYKATVSRIYPYFDRNEQSFIAEATFDEKISNLRSGTQLQANIKTKEKANALVIPAEYLLPGDFIIDKKNGKVKVVVGIRSSAWVEILSGVDDATTILLPK